MNKVVIYIHGNGGNAAEARHYRSLFHDCDVIGFDYKAETPWEAKSEFGVYFDGLRTKYERITVIANSIGAFFLMNAEPEKPVDLAYFISPVVDMGKLISDMMMWAGVTEDELRVEKRIETSSGETLSWEYLDYVRKNRIKWSIPTHILYGGRDELISFESVSEFAGRTRATLDVMPGGEHWFHTDEQMEFLDKWINKYRKMR